MRHLKSALLLVIILLMIVAGCTTAKYFHRTPPPFPPEIKSIAVVGFRSAIDRGASPGVIRSPISGAAFTARPIPQSITENMSDRLFEMISEYDFEELVPPAQVHGVISTLVSSHPTMTEIEILKRTGKAFSADAALVGYLYRWEERVGSNYAVRSAASVAFDLYLVRPGDGSVLWKERFDLTQKSLSENLLEVDTFIWGHGKWMTAHQLAELGLHRMLEGLEQ